MTKPRLNKVEQGWSKVDQGWTRLNKARWSDDDSSEYRGDDDLVDRLDTSHNISQDYDDYHDFNNLYDWEVVFLMLGLRLIRSQQNNPFAYFEINFYLLGIL